MHRTSEGIAQEFTECSSGCATDGAGLWHPFVLFGGSVLRAEHSHHFKCIMSLAQGRTQDTFFVTLRVR